jgi:protein-S-isoprenylcysteine O-methyltransferase Ste14
MTKSKMKSKAKIWLWFAVTFILIGIAQFLSAGTINYWQEWVYLGVGTVSSALLMLSIIKDPVLLDNRLKAGPQNEQRAIQKIIVLLMGIPAIAAFIVPALDRRFGWSNVPSWLSIVGDLLILISMWMVYRVFKENSFGSTTVEVTNNQKVISTGPYAIVRNPMYTSAAVYFIGMSLSLGSYWGLIASILTIFGFVLRLLDEEKFLAQNLPGYTEYEKKVRYHLVPFVW